MNTQWFFIKQELFHIIVKYIYVLIICTKCKYQLPVSNIQNTNNTPCKTQITTVLLHSNDPFSTIIRTIKKELYLNNINVNDNLYTNLYSDNYINKNTILLKILNISENHVTVSVFQNGTEAEYQIILEIQAEYSYLINKVNYYPINVRIWNTFIRDPNAILSNLIQEKEIIESMYIDSAQKLTQKLLMQLKY